MAFGPPRGNDWLRDAGRDAHFMHVCPFPCHRSIVHLEYAALGGRFEISTRDSGVARLNSGIDPE